MKCLGEQITALVDGVLPDAAREAAFAHIAICVNCRREVELERATKFRIANLAPAPMTDQLRATLVGLATRPLLPPQAVTTGAIGPRPPLLRPAAAAFTPVAGTHRWTRTAVTGVVACSLGAVLVGTMSGHQDGPGGGTGRVVTPAPYVQQHDATTVGLLQDPALLMVERVSLP